MAGYTKNCVCKSAQKAETMAQKSRCPPWEHDLRPWGADFGAQNFPMLVSYRRNTEGLPSSWESRKYDRSHLLGFCDSP